MSSKKKGMKYEKIISKFLQREYDLEVDQNINSGAFNFDKGDLTAYSDENTYMVEAKSTEKNNYRLNVKTVEKACEEAADKLQEPLLVILSHYKRTIKIAISTAITVIKPKKIKYKSYKLDFTTLEDCDNISCKLKGSKYGAYKINFEIHKYKR